MSPWWYLRGREKKWGEGEQGEREYLVVWRVRERRERDEYLSLLLHSPLFCVVGQRRVCVGRL